MTGHISQWDYDDGWITVSCEREGCGWSITVPDAETGGDAWGDHMYEVGYADSQAGTRPADPAVAAVEITDLEG